MKIFTFFVPLLCLEFALLVSSQSLAEEYAQLLVVNDEERQNAQDILTSKHIDFITEIRQLVSDQVIPALNEVNEGISDHIQNLINQTFPLGYNSTRCIQQFTEYLKSGVVPNITEKALNESSSIYEEITSSIVFSGMYNLQVISEEIYSIEKEYDLCINSESPEYCNKTLVRKIQTKQGEIPLLYAKEVESTIVALVQHVADFESRVQDYVQEATIVIKPYLALLENCMAIIFTLG